ncbi:MAG TPA: alpha/beta hydrolase [Caulobacteraceae bacterium]|nr:alpha/beta hydrolase [Caulobacteraceae bacterium]
MDAAPLYATDAAPIPEGADAEWFTGAGGARLRAALIPAKATPRGSVVLSGGRTEPIEKYFEVIGELTGRGFTVLAHDWRGQGLSQRLLPDRLRGHARGADDFVADYAALVAAFEARLPKPWLAVGHSMGGCLTALVLARGERRFAGAVLSAPMLGLYTTPIPPPLARWLAGTLTLLGLGKGGTPGGDAASFETNILTHDPRRYARNVGQVAAYPDLALGAPTWSWLAFAFSAIRELQTGPGVPKVEIPVTIIGAGEDRIIDNAGTQRVASRFPHGRYVEAPGAFHEVLQETDEIRAAFWREFDALAGQVAPAS